MVHVLKQVMTDSREKIHTYELLCSLFPEITFTREAMHIGDYATDHVLVERKSMADLYASIINKRLISQFERMSVITHQVHVLMIVGSLKTFCNSMNFNKGVPDVNIEMMRGAIASTACRYSSHVLWFESEEESFYHMIKFMDMVEEGKYEVPAKRNPDVLMARYLKVTLIQWNDIKRLFPSMHELQDACVDDLKQVYGIGPKKAMNIKAVLLGDFV